MNVMIGLYGHGIAVDQQHQQQSACRLTSIDTQQRSFQLIGCFLSSD